MHGRFCRGFPALTLNQDKKRSGGKAADHRGLGCQFFVPELFGIMLHPMRIFSAALAVAVAILEVGCAPAVVVGEAGPSIDLGGRFTADTVAGGKRSAGGGSFTPHFKVVRNGIARDAMVLEAPVTIRATLDGVSRGAVLECLSTPVFNIGDGMQMDVFLSEEGRQRAIFSRYYDAGRRMEDRAWIRLSIPLDLESSQAQAQLEIRVSGGPQGDLVADWLALSMVRVVQKQREQ